MSIQSVFDKARPSSGGGDKSWIEADFTDGSWTIQDTAGLVGSVTRANSRNLFTEAAVTAGDALVLSATGGFTGWRAYKALVDVNGNPITTDTVGSLGVIMRSVPPATRSQALFIFGISVDPTSDVTNTLNQIGLGLYQPTTGNQIGWYYNTEGGGLLTGAPTTVHGNILFGYGRYSTAFGVASGDDEVRDSQSGRNYGGSIGSAVPLYLTAVYSKRFNSDSGLVGTQMSLKAYYRPPHPDHPALS